MAGFGSDAFGTSPFGGGTGPGGGFTVDTAAGLGAAPGARTRIAATPTAAAGTGAALDLLTPGVGYGLSGYGTSPYGGSTPTTTGTGTGTGTALGPSVTVVSGPAAHPTTAAASGTAPFNPAGGATNTELTSLGPIYADGAAYNPGTRTAFHTGVATGSGTAYVVTGRGSALPVTPVGGGLDIAVFAVDRTTGALVPLPHYTELTLSPIANAPGAATIAYPRGGLNFALLQAIAAADVDVEVEVWLRGSHTGSIRALLDQASGDQADPDAVWTFAGTFLEGRMDQALVGVNAANTKKETPFAAATAGTILRTLMQRCQGRGELTDLTYASFSNTADSNNMVWQLQASPTFSPKDSLLDVLDSLVEMGMCEWEITADHQLKLYNAGTRGRDLTALNPPVAIWAGRSVLDGEIKHSTRDAATHLLVEGKDGLYVEVSDPTALARRGRRVTKVVSAGNIADTGSLQAYGQTQMQVAGRGKRELTQGLNFGAADPLPMATFGVGDWIYSGSEYGIERLRVAQWVLSIRAGQAAQGSVTVNDLFADRALQLSRRIKALERGTSVVGTSTAAAENDTMPPATPTGLVLSSLPYTGSAGAKLAQVSASWNAVTSNLDGSAIDDLSGYRLAYRFLSPGLPNNWIEGPFSQSTVATVSGLPQNMQMEFQVAAVDWRGNLSGWSASAFVVTEVDNVPPPTPSAPDPFNQQGVLLIGWDGLGAAGEQMPSDFSHLRIHKSASASFTADASNRLPLELRGAGNVAYEPTPAELDTTVYFVFVAVDNTGNTSAQSAVGSAVPTVPAATVDEDLLQQALENANIDWGEAIAPESITTKHLSIASFGDNEAVNGSFEDLAEGDPTLPARWEITGVGTGLGATVALDATAGNVFAGRRSVKVTLDAGAVRHVELRSAWVPTRPGEIWFFEAAAKASRAHAGWTLTVDYTSEAVPTTASANAIGLLNEVFPTAYATESFQSTAPVTTGGAPTKWVRFKAEARNNDSAALDVWFDDLRARKVVGRAEIADAAIGTAQIGLAEITNANIGNVSVGKLIGGTATFAMLMASGNIRSADNLGSGGGQGYILDPAGFRLYNSANVNTVSLNTNGTASLTGTVQTGTTGRRIRMTGGSNTIEFLPQSGEVRSGKILSFIPTNYPDDIQIEIRASDADTLDVFGRVEVRPEVVLMSCGWQANKANAKSQIIAGEDFVELRVMDPTKTPGTGALQGGSLKLSRELYGKSELVHTYNDGAQNFVRLNGDPGDIEIYKANVKKMKIGSTRTCVQEIGSTVGPGERAHIKTENSGAICFYRQSNGQLSVGDAQSGSFLGVIPFSVKTFVIDHPLDSARQLVHATTESPHAGVEYWGTATVEDGEAVVQLPGYFEALTREDGRSVQLTVLAEDDPQHRLQLPRRTPRKAPGPAPPLPAPYGQDAPPPPPGLPMQVQASYPRDGRFTIWGYGDHADTFRVFWLVKAVRKDVPALDVEPLKSSGTVRGDGPYTYFVPGAPE